MAKEIILEIGKCYEVLKLDGSTISFSFWGGQLAYGKILSTGENVLISSLLDKITSCYEIPCPSI